MSVYDLVIIGGGPAGLAAGIYGARARMKTAILEKGAVGGQAFTTREIVNFPGFKSTSGPELMKTIAGHAKEFGTEIIKGEVTDVDFSGEIKLINTKKGQQYQAKAVILALGSQPRLLNIPGEKPLRGSGVSYCATCDAEFYTDLDVVVVGNGDAAIEEAMYITKYARKVTVIVLHDVGIVDCNRASAEKAFNNPKIEFVWNSVLAEIKGKGEVESVVVKNLKTGELTELAAHGVFIYVGMIPGTDFVKGKIELDERGYILANEQMETSVDGVFAAGDARVKYLRQVVTAANDGAIAAVSAERYLDEEQSFKDEVVNVDKPVALVFWSPASNESIDMASRLDALIAAAGGKYKVVKVDVSRKKRIAQKYNVEVIPSILLLEKGELQLQLNGNVDDDTIKAQLKI
ncbi:thioredoxin-disulfide reductase [Desulforamulus aquiferis]|uniref:Thioredoxin reductase n=1 Tax=Desulforamulus aquiferis TaxID=1397668 RepID=A0AAW7Z8L8_9FIRM|nr:thioredoxin-disulfide reductase [Desulforamulus aquiferis]MDO7786032.1 thioredoxin-disulfide reductase [Desulforamulus aquiferis]